MKRRLMLIFIIVCMCILVGIGGVVTFINSNSVFKQNKKTKQTFIQDISDFERTNFYEHLLKC
jgi:flagellar basal body-associated protein FliL